MSDFLWNYSFMVAGGVLVQILRALALVGKKQFEFGTFLSDPQNYQRFILLALAFLVIQYLFVFEGTFILDAMKAVGFIIPIAASSVVGFLLTLAAFKLKSAITNLFS